MRTLWVLGLAAATLSLTGCGGTFPIQQLPQHEVTQSQSAIHDAVIKAANERKFMVEKDTPSSVALVYPPGQSRQIHSVPRPLSGGYRTSLVRSQIYRQHGA